MHIERIDKRHLIHQDQLGIFALCEQAFEEDLRPYFVTFQNPIHLIVRQDGMIVGHACIVERWLQMAHERPMRTAYVEAVATQPAYQGQGIGSALMREVVAEAERQGYEIGALSPSAASYYERLGWELWQGPLAFRKDGQIIQSDEDEEAMIYRLPRTPLLDKQVMLSIEWRSGDEIW